MMARRRWSRRKKRAVFSLLALCLLCALYAIFIESRWLQITRIELHLAKLPARLDGLRIVHLTDIHYPRGLDAAYFRRVVRETNALNPDLVLITGDFIARAAEDADGCAHLLAGLRATEGVYGVLGNHDYWTSAAYVARALRREGITVLRNQSVAIQRGGARLWIVGLNDHWKRADDLPAAMRGVPAATEPVILLVHEPDFTDIAAREPIDLQLSGHAHGGLVWIPGLGAPILQQLCRKYPRGLYRVNAMYLYSNRGIGVIPILNLPFRFNARPEIALITLRAGAGPSHPAPRVRRP
ncbi:MAG TPA: metallophosphoesterase [Armatimonadota bacterium]|nr:metallophosphoesterase [Armatimonadota bacterium]